jgi:tripartite-type tricarboxylate transporter receptor subunit TctC
MRLSRFMVFIYSVGIVLINIDAASAQAYPSKPIRIVTSPAGGGSDFVTRLVAQGLTGPLGQPIVVDNRTLFISGEVASRSPPDGYTLLLSSSTLWVATLLQKAPYDPVADFAPISTTTRSPNMLVVHPSLPAKSVQDLIALAKARPGVLNYGSSTIGSSLHLAAELFKSMAGVNITHISYKATGIAVNDLLGGHLELMFSSISPVIPHVKTGKLRALAITTTTPSALLPGLPTVAASGLPGYESVSLDGLFAPAKTPAAIISRLHQELVRLLNQPEVKEKFFNTGSEVVGNSPEEFGAAVRGELTRLSKVIKDAGIRAD